MPRRRRLAELLCSIWVHWLVIHDGFAVDLGRTDRPRTEFSQCACGKRKKFRKPKK